MKKRLHTAIPPSEATVAAIASALPTALPLATEFPCLNPTCETGAIVKRGNTKGRPKLFCSAACRRRYDHERDQLHLDLQVLEIAISKPGGTFRQRKAVLSTLAGVRRSLLHYTYLNTGGQAD